MTVPDDTVPGDIEQLIRYVNEQIELLNFDSPEPSLLRRMVEGLTDARKSVRVDLIEAFGQIGEPATPFLLEGLATHPQAQVRRTCCHALSNIGDPLAVSGLVQALQNDTDIVVKGAAASALARIGAPAFKSLCRVLASDVAEESCKGQAAWAIASMSSEVAQPLYEATADSSPAVRLAAVGAIAQLATQSKDPNALKALHNSIQDDSPEVRIETIAALARLNDPDGYRYVVKLLSDSEEEVRKAAVLALGKFNRPSAAEAIAPLTRDPSPQVQRIAALVLSQL